MYKFVKVLPIPIRKCPLYVVERNGKQFFAKTVDKNLKHLYMDNENKELILKECFYLEKLCNSGIAPMYIDSYQSEEDVTVIMEYLDSDWSDLFDYLDKDLEEDTIKIIIRNIVLSIKKLSKYNIHYLDIKPENIMINIKDYDIRIIDFEDALYSDVKNPIILYDIGTEGYKCPERINGSFTVLESQVYSIGRLLLYCFDRSTNCNDMYRINKSKCSELVKDLIGKCLEHDPTKRIYIDDILWHAWFND